MPKSTRKTGVSRHVRSSGPEESAQASRLASSSSLLLSQLQLASERLEAEQSLYRNLPCKFHTSLSV